MYKRQVVDHIRFIRTERVHQRLPEICLFGIDTEISAAFLRFLQAHIADVCNEYALDVYKRQEPFRRPIFRRHHSDTDIITAHHVMFPDDGLRIVENAVGVRMSQYNFQPRCV